MQIARRLVVLAGLCLFAACLLQIVPGYATAQAAASRTAPAAAVLEASEEAVPGPVVLIGTAGLTWADVPPDDPVLGPFVNDGAIGSVAVRGIRAVSCPIDGWLAISSGRRAGDVATVRSTDPLLAEPYCRPLRLPTTTPGGSATVPRWGIYTEMARTGDFEATPGLLGTTLRSAGVPTAAVGPGAAVALAVPDGSTDTATVPVAYSGVDPAADVSAALEGGAELVVVDVGAIRDPDSLAKNEPIPTGSAAVPLAEQVDATVTRIGAVLDVLPEGTTVLLASIADAGQQPHLQLAAGQGPRPGGGAYASGLLWTASTRQDGLIQTTDLMPTLLAAVGTNIPSQAVGSVIRSIAAEPQPLERYEHVLDLDRAAQKVRPIVPVFFNGLVVAQLVLYGAATVALRLDRPDPARRRRVLRLLRAAAVVFASVPAATFLANLVPWWRAPYPGLAVTATVTLFVVPIAALALLGPWRDRLLGPFGLVAGVTAVVLAGDVLTGSHLMLSSLMGVQPLVAGRFYGFSNPGFALFATGALLLATALADALLRSGRRLAAVATVVCLGVVATVIDGMPGWGSDFGGPPAMVPAFAVLALLVAGVRVTWRRAALIAVGTVVVIVALSLLDWARPASERTHLGRFVQTVIDGGAWPVIRRKAAQNWQILTTSELSALLPFAVAFVAMVLARPSAWGVRPLQLAYDRSPALRHGLVAFAVLVAIGFAVNDSGTAIPAVAATVFIPLLIAASSRALEMHEEEQVPQAGRSAGGQPPLPARGDRPDDEQPGHREQQPGGQVPALMEHERPDLRAEPHDAARKVGQGEHREPG